MLLSSHIPFCNLLLPEPWSAVSPAEAMKARTNLQDTLHGRVTVTYVTLSTFLSSVDHGTHS